MKNTLEFTQAIIQGINQQLKESFELVKKTDEKDHCDCKKDHCDCKEDLLENEEEVEVIKDKDTVEEKPDEIETEEKEEIKIKDGENFEESLTDKVYFCNYCKKHFIATVDTPVEDIICPLCNGTDMLIDIGSAADALEKKENEDVAVEIKTEEKEEEDETVDDVSEEDLEFESEGLEEGLKFLAQKHINEKTIVKLQESRINSKGDLIIKGKTIPNKTNFTIMFEGFENKVNSLDKKFILEGNTSLFSKPNKLKAIFVREGNKFSIKKCGYGFISKNKQIKGILG